MAVRVWRGRQAGDPETIEAGVAIDIQQGHLLIRKSAQSTRAITDVVAAWAPGEWRHALVES